MAEITLPNANDFTMLGTPRLLVPSQANRSAWTGRRKVIGLAGTELWQAKALIGPFSTEADERAWRAFLWQLDGPANWFRAPLPCNSHSGSKPLVNAASSNGYTLTLDGMTHSTTLLVAGQFMTVPLPSGKYRAVCLTSDLVTNGSGQATAAFRPALTEIPTDNAEVETLAPFIPMSLVGNTSGISGDGGTSSETLDLEEAL